MNPSKECTIMKMTIPGVSIAVWVGIMVISLLHTVSNSLPNKSITESVAQLYTSTTYVGKPAVTVGPTPHHQIVQNTSDVRLVKFVASHWRLPVSKASRIVGAAFKYGKRYNVPPLFILSEIATESSFQTKAYSSVSAVGIMQVYPKEHWAYAVRHGYTGAGYKHLFRVVPNIKFGSYVLARYYHTYGTVNRAAAHYFGICSFDKIYVRRIDTNLSLLESRA
jgi:hypothetical protein